jgi:shikimate kinase
MSKEPQRVAHTARKKLRQAHAKKAGHIIFIGFMGCGKSTIARKIARSEGMPVLDMDRAIEQEAGMSIPEIFAAEGEAGFRRREHAFLESLRTHAPCMLSCGGGIITRAENRKMLKALGTVIYLQVSAAEALSRIAHPETRPLLAGAVAPADLLEQRRPLYEETADIIFDTNGLSVGRVSHELARFLKKQGIL